MATSILIAESIKGELVDAGVPAVLDVRDVLGNVPCVLVPPPTWDDWQADGSPSFLWRLIVISSHPLGNLDAWRELDELVTAVANALPIERAEPIAYSLPTGGAPLPAYAVTLTTGS